MWVWHGNLRIRTKLFITYFSVLVLMLAVSSFLTYSLIKKTIDTHISDHMNSSLDSIQELVAATTDLAVKNKLRSIVERRASTLAFHLDNARRGYVTEPAARIRALNELISEPIGTSGYLYAIDSKGIIKAHPEPELVGVDVASRDFIIKTI